MRWLSTSIRTVEGPVTSLAATTHGEVYDDNVSRCLVVAVDETDEQTWAVVVDYQTVSEVVALRVADIELVAGCVYVAESVSNLGRTLPLVTYQIMTLHGYLTENRSKLLREKPNPGKLLVSRFGLPLKSQAIKRIVNPGGQAKRYLPFGVKYCPKLEQTHQSAEGSAHAP